MPVYIHKALDLMDHRYIWSKHILEKLRKCAYNNEMDFLRSQQIKLNVALRSGRRTESELRVYRNSENPKVNVAFIEVLKTQK